MANISANKKTTILSSSVTLILVIIKFIIGLTNGSVALLVSVIDSLLDSAVSIFNYFVITKSEERANNEYQYGKGKVQTIAGVIEGTVITISGIYIIYISLQKVINKSTITLLLPSILVMIFLIIITYLLVIYLLKIVKDTDNIEEGIEILLDKEIIDIMKDLGAKKI